MPWSPRTSRAGYSKARLAELADALHTAARALYVAVSFISCLLTAFSTPVGPESVRSMRSHSIRQAHKRRRLNSDSDSVTASDVEARYIHFALLSLISQVGGAR